MLLPYISKNKEFPAGELAAALVISIIAGVVASTGEYIYAIALIGSVFAIYIAISPSALLFAMILIGLVFAGLFRTYFPQLEYIRWVLLPGSIVLCIHALISGLTPNTVPGNYKFPAILWWAIAFLIVTFSSGIINGVGPNIYLAAYKGYFQVWGILIALAFINYDKKTVEQIPKLFLIIAFVQLPLVLQQYFILAPSRVGIAKGIVPIDVVSGTFGISTMGGNNALLSAYLFICIAGCIALWQEKVWSSKTTLLISALLFWPTLMNEAKIGLLFLIAIFSVLFFKYIFSSARTFILSVLGLILTVSILLWAFTVNVHENADVSNPIELLQYTYESNVEKDENWKGGLSRFGSYKYWFEMHGVENSRNTLIGHGVGASRQRQEQKNIFDILSGPDASIGIGSTAFSAILWESGLLGLICVLGMFISGFMGAIKLSNRYADDKYKRAIFRAISAAFVILFIDFMSKSYFVFQLGYQTIFFTLLGYVVYWDKISTDKPQDIPKNRH